MTVQWVRGPLGWVNLSKVVRMFARPHSDQDETWDVLASTGPNTLYLTLAEGLESEAAAEAWIKRLLVGVADWGSG